MAFRRRLRGTRERTEWIGAIQVTPQVVAVNTNQNTTLVSTATFEEYPGGRLDRLIGQMFISPATAPAAASGYGVFVGFTLLGPNESVDPELNPEHRWVHWTSVFPQIGGNAAADSNAARWVGYFRLDFDMRIRRRFQDDQTFNMFVKNSNSSAASIQWSCAFRLLVAAGRK